MWVRQYKKGDIEYELIQNTSAVWGSVVLHTYATSNYYIETKFNSPPSPSSLIFPDDGGGEGREGTLLRRPLLFDGEDDVAAMIVINCVGRIHMC